MTAITLLSLVLLSEGPKLEGAAAQPGPRAEAVAAEFRENIRKEVLKKQAAQARKGRARRLAAPTPVPMFAFSGVSTGAGGSTRDDRDDLRRDNERLRNERDAANQQAAQEFAWQQQVAMQQQAAQQYLWQQQVAMQQHQAMMYQAMIHHPMNGFAGPFHGGGMTSQAGGPHFASVGGEPAHHHAGSH